MHSISITQAFVLSLLASAPLAAAFTTEAAAHDVERRHVGSPASYASNVVRAVVPELSARHHTEV